MKWNNRKMKQPVRCSASAREHTTDTFKEVIVYQYMQSFYVCSRGRMGFIMIGQGWKAEKNHPT